MPYKSKEQKATYDKGYYLKNKEQIVAQKKDYCFKNRVIVPITSVIIAIIIIFITII